jgi:hypothetical protein
MSSNDVRKERADKGSKRIVSRDLEALMFIEDMRAIAESDLGVLLSRISGNSEPVKISGVRHVVRRWVAQGWATTRPNPWQGGRIVELKAAGAMLVTGVDRRPTQVAYALIPHTVWLSRIRLAYEAQGWTWESERTIYRDGTIATREDGTTFVRGGLDEETGKPLEPRQRGEHQVDGIATSPAGRRVGIECELTVKQPWRLDAIVPALATDLRHERVHYWTPADVGPHVSAAIARFEERARSGAWKPSMGEQAKNPIAVRSLDDLGKVLAGEIVIPAG